VDAKTSFMKEEIAVSATREEWQEVIEWVLKYAEPRDNAPASLIYWLINQGVYKGE